MSKTERKKQLNKRIIKTILLFTCSVVFFITVENKPNTTTYAIPSDTATTGNHYKYVTERKGKAVYIGKEKNIHEFLTSDGEVFGVLGNGFKKGKTYILTIQDNGTENIKDDEVINVE